MSVSTPDSSLQLLFLGTGTSTGLPLTPCLTLTQPYPEEFSRHLPLAPPRPDPPKGHYNPDGQWPDTIPCACCRAAVSPDVPEGWKNRRGNTSVIVRKKGLNREGDEVWKNVIVDVGKTFREQSARFFPRWGVDRLDAVILTHGHADAYYGLDDLREWCFRQNCVIPIYLNQETYNTVAMSFPYLVDRKKASGGGDVPALRFHIIEDHSDFEVEGIRVRALPAEHGVYFRDDKREPLICLGFMFDESIIYMSDVSAIPERTWERMLDRTPPARHALKRFGSDTGEVLPDDFESPNRPKSRPVSASASSQQIESLAKRLREKVMIPPTPQDTPRTSRSHSPVGGSGSGGASLAMTTSNSSASGASTSPKGDDGPHMDGNSSSSSSGSAERPLPILVLDSLWPLVPHSSHIDMVTALKIALRLRPSMMYLVDLVHPISHYMWEEVCLSIRGEHAQRPPHPDDEQAQELVGRFWRDRHVKKIESEIRGWEGRVQPGWDGLVVQVDQGGSRGVVEGPGGSGPGIL